MALEANLQAHLSARAINQSHKRIIIIIIYFYLFSQHFFHHLCLRRDYKIYVFSRCSLNGALFFRGHSPRAAYMAGLDGQTQKPDLPSVGLPYICKIHTRTRTFGWFGWMTKRLQDEQCIQL